MNRRAIYPGTFDPVTYGHIDIITRASKLFDEVIVAVANNSQKAPLFNLEDRIMLLEHVTKDIKGVTIDSFNQLMVDYVSQKKVNVVIRGLRMISDFEFEFQMALTNRKLNNTIETFFMMPNESYSFVSSKLIKEVARLGADLSEFVPQIVEEKLKQTLH